LPGERTPEEIFVDISKIIDVAFYGKKPGKIHTKLFYLLELQKKFRKIERAAFGLDGSYVLG